MGDDEPDFIARIIDFGLARLMDRAGEEMTASFAAMGSAPFMAPEQAEGRRSVRRPTSTAWGRSSMRCSAAARRTRGRRPGDLAPGRGRRADRAAPASAAEVPRDLEAICPEVPGEGPGAAVRRRRRVADDLNRFLTGEPTRARPPAAGTSPAGPRGDIRRADRPGDRRRRHRRDPCRHLPVRGSDPRNPGAGRPPGGRVPASSRGRTPRLVRRGPSMGPFTHRRS